MCEEPWRAAQLTGSIYHFQEITLPHLGQINPTREVSTIYKTSRVDNLVQF
jgi:hypothetical protein